MKWKAPEIWNKADCFILGGGHSIADVFDVPKDLIPIRQEEFIQFGDYLKPYLSDKHVIGVNLSAFLGDWVDVAYWGDSDTYLHYKGWYDAFGGLKVASAGKFSSNKFKTVMNLPRARPKSGICTNRTHLTWVGYNSGAAAINLAYYLGAVRIFLLGFDMYSLPDGRVHWHGGYPDKKENFTIKDMKAGKVPKRSTSTPAYKRQLNGFDSISKGIAKVNVQVINLSPNSKVQEFPIASFWDYFPKDSA